MRQVQSNVRASVFQVTAAEAGRSLGRQYFGWNTRENKSLRYEPSLSQVLPRLLCILPHHCTSQEGSTAPSSLTSVLRFKEASQRCQTLKLNLPDAYTAKQDRLNLKASSEG